MAQSLFERFCDDNNIVSVTRAAFREWLKRKYGEVPKKADWKAEWAEFYRESTSKT